MGKASRTKRAGTARERIAAQRAAQRRAEIRNRVLLASGAVVVVIAIVVAFVVVRLNSKPPKAGPNSPTGTVLTAKTQDSVTSVPAAALDRVGAGSVPSYDPTPITAVSGSPLTSGGKPEMLYIGAEYCPYCAAMRWSMAVALSRFGSFTTPLHGIRSSPTDVFANTPTLTFYKARYISKYLAFVPVEVQRVDKAPLQRPNAQQSAIWARYEPGNQGYPFIDFGNKFLIKVPIYNPGVLAGKTWAQVAAALHDPSSAIAQGALGAANYITAAICKLTSNQPASACTAAVKALEAKF